jgi:hypothetical protein
MKLTRVLLQVMELQTVVKKLESIPGDDPMGNIKIQEYIQPHELRRNGTIIGPRYS